VRAERCPECYKRKDAHHLALGRCPAKDPPPKVRGPSRASKQIKEIGDGP